jgi:hypothetical protein
MSEEDELELLALYSGDHPLPRVSTAARWRPWMDATRERFANRCLPLLMANEAGWVLENPAAFTARWTGGERPETVTVEYAPDTPEHLRLAKAHFGYGIVTFVIPLVFRSPSGFNLLARGPANHPKHGISPLEGLVETDWSAAAFTMNWKITAPDLTVRFDEGEPFCQIVPQRRGELEGFETGYVRLADAGDLAERVRQWDATRLLFQAGKRAARAAGEDEWSRIWMSDYFKGSAPSGDAGGEHQTKLRLAPFEKPDSD